MANSGSLASSCGVEAQVLEHQELGRLEPADGVLRADAQRVAGDGHAASGAAPTAAAATGRRRADSTTLPLGRPRWLIRMTVAFWSSRYLMVGMRGADARVVLDLAVLDRDVEVDAHEHSSCPRLEVADGELFHGCSLGCGGRCAAGRQSRAV